MRREREEGEEERKVREGEGWREGEGMDLLDQCQAASYAPLIGLTVKVQLETAAIS